MWRDDPARVRPMLASTQDAPLVGRDLVYEPKYDGIRALAAVEPGAKGVGVRLWSRLGNDKTAQFPEVVAALVRWGQTLAAPVLLDGEIVALDAHGEPTGFEPLQGRMHRTRRPADDASLVPTAYVLFDVLRDGRDDLRSRPLTERRRRLEALVRRNRSRVLRLGEQVAGNAGGLWAAAHERGWEGLIAKQASSPYQSGRRSHDWRKLKLVRTQSCVIGGWTSPRGTRHRFGALIVGVYEGPGRLQYVAHVGSGFSDAELERLWTSLQPLGTGTSPFSGPVPANERPHWVRPHLVAEVKFTEWTSEGRLRHPTYLGLRVDVTPSSVRREPDSVASPRRLAAAASRGPAWRSGTGSGRARARDTESPAIRPQAADILLAQLDAIEGGRGGGTLDLGVAGTLAVTNLGKPFWPGRGLTKGDLLRHYVRVASCILPVLADRPLVLKRFPNGVTGKPFYQHRITQQPPAGVRVEQAAAGDERRAHLVGGDLLTLLYTAQLGAISQDPWLSRIGSEASIDHAVLDLDPAEGLPFARIRDVARHVRDELGALGAPAFLKTSGSRGLHVFVPMPPDLPYDAGLLFAQIVATIVAKKHPRHATVERSLKARGPRVYVDYLQNGQGKTLASAYSVRATDAAGVSTPLTWTELEEGATPGDFTLPTFADRLAAVGDLWAGLRTSPPADLHAVMRYAEPEAAKQSAPSTRPQRSARTGTRRAAAKK